MKTSSLFLLLSSLLLVSPVHGGAPLERVAEPVPYSDLDLGSPSGRATLEGRIRQAVNTACGEASAVDLVGASQVRRCRAEARSLAQVQVERALASIRRSAPTAIALGR